MQSASPYPAIVPQRNYAPGSNPLGSPVTDLILFTAGVGASPGILALPGADDLHGLRHDKMIVLPRAQLAPKVSYGG